MPRKVLDVSKHPDGWQVKAEGGQRASKVTDTKAEAVQAAAAQARREGNAQVRIKREDGTIQDERTYGNDPFPPKG